MTAEGGVLLVDDDPTFLRSLESILRGAGISPVESLPDGRGVLDKVNSMRPDTVCLDLGLGEMDGRRILSDIRSGWPEIGVVVVSGNRDLETAVDCMRSGASDYLPKPFRADAFIQAVQRVQSRSGCSHASAADDDGEILHPEAFAELLTRSDLMHEVFAYAESVAPSRLPILVTGETGTGKELMARALHGLRSPQAPFFAVNTAGLDDTTFSDALFGHVAGAFTGGERARSGFVEEAGDGTLFLDEIGDLSPSSQVRLLRLLQEGEYFPVGSDRPKRGRCRFVVATHKDIATDPGFRPDLFWRLQSHRIHLPPLRERKEDIPLLCRHFLSEAARDLGREVPEPSAEFLQRLADMDFPGNIRELRGLVHDLAARNRGQWPKEPVGKAPDMPHPGEFPTLSKLQARHIEEALEKTGGNRTAAAEMLGISRQTLITRLKRSSPAGRQVSLQLGV